ncbi:MAG: hypothetical protein KBG60_00365 [Anaerolineaceae bacterium]|nr:hypothetical protein [Anaerolineaceae bacterium]
MIWRPSTSDIFAEIDAYFYEQVFLVFDAYRKVKEDYEMGLQNDKQAAIHACYQLFHFREHLPNSVNISELAKRCGDFELVRDVANISKHSKVNKYKTNVKNIQEVLVITLFSDEFGEYVNQEKLVEIELIDGSKRNLLEVMTNVVNMWFDFLTEKGISKPRNPIVINTQCFVSREKAKHVNLSMVQGLQFTQNFRVQFFNKDKNLIEPVDLGGMDNIIFRVYKPTVHQIVLNDQSGEVITKDLTLTPEEEGFFNSIQENEDKNR